MMQTDASGTQDDPALAEVTGVDTPAPQIDAAQPQVQPDRKRNGFGGVILGGVIAAVAGFAVAQIVPNGWPLAATADLSTQLAAQAVQIDALQNQLATAPEIPLTDPVILDRLTALEGKPDFDAKPVENRIAELEGRLTAIEKLPADGSGATSAAVVALQADLQALRAAIEAQNSNGTALETEAQLKQALTIAAETTKNADDLATSVRRLAALGQLQTAFDTGAAFAPALAQLAAETDPIPAILADNADSGLPTLAQLETAFPPAARLGLDAALRANMGASWSERAASFLRSQTGARSLEPREGSDPDAVLSRAEAALNAGDLAAVLTELQALPPEAQPALAQWRALAETRLAAQAAIAALAATIGK